MLFIRINIPLRTLRHFALTLNPRYAEIYGEGCCYTRVEFRTDYRLITIIDHIKVVSNKPIRKNKIVMKAQNFKCGQNEKPTKPKRTFKWKIQNKSSKLKQPKFNEGKTNVKI